LTSSQNGVCVHAVAQQHDRAGAMTLLASSSACASSTPPMHVAPLGVIARGPDVDQEPAGVAGGRALEVGERDDAELADVVTRRPGSSTPHSWPMILNVVSRAPDESSTST
jgi:hypothetical protein